jgi:excisionase family DNA binding protein
MDNLLSVKQAAYILKIHPLTVRRYIKENRLRAIKVGGNVRIKDTDLSEFNKEYVPNKPVNKNTLKQSSFKTFTEIDTIFQLQGKGASLDLSV